LFYSNLREILFFSSHFEIYKSFIDFYETRLLTNLILKRTNLVMIFKKCHLQPFKLKINQKLNQNLIKNMIQQKKKRAKFDLTNFLF